MSTLLITELTHTCLACPSQWEGRLSDGRPLYIRYRWGYLKISVDVKGEVLFAQKIPGASEGFLELSDVLRYSGMKLADGVVVTECKDENDADRATGIRCSIQKVADIDIMPENESNTTNIL